MKKQSLVRVAFAAGLAVSTCIQSVHALEPEEDPMYVEGFYGMAEPAVVYYDGNGQLTAFSFPTPHGTIVGGKTVNNDVTTLKLSLSGFSSTEQLTLRAQPLSSEETQLAVYRSTTEVVTFSVTSTDAVVTSTTVEYCSEIPTLTLLDAVHDARAATDGVVPNSGMTDSTHYFAVLNRLLRDFDYAAPLA